MFYQNDVKGGGYAEYPGKRNALYPVRLEINLAYPSAVTHLELVNASVQMGLVADAAPDLPAARRKSLGFFNKNTQTPEKFIKVTFTNLDS